MADHQQRPILVCNVCWMARYQGLHDQPTRSLAAANSSLTTISVMSVATSCRPRMASVFGHFETIKGKKDRKVSLERLPC